MSYNIVYLNAFPAIDSDFDSIAKLMGCLMMRNVATSGWVINDSSARDSKPGCVIASPSYPAGDPGTDQDYVHHWTRDAAIVAMEFAAAQNKQSMEDYVSFCKATLDPANLGGNPLDWACFYVDGHPRPWNAQSDGPALLCLAIMAGWALLSAPVQLIAKDLVHKNLVFLLSNYPNKTTNLWEETFGHSLFARAVQLRCFRVALANAASLGLTAAEQASLNTAKIDLAQHIQNDHWAPPDRRYRSIYDAVYGRGWDLNVDAVMASVYGDLDCTDPQLLSTAAQVRNAFAHPSSPWYYGINGWDASGGRGPLIGRYPMDTYDGNLGDGETLGGHPWAPCTCNFAEFYYRIAKKHNGGQAVVINSLTEDFYNQVGITASTLPADVPLLLRDAGDRMLRAIVYHSDHLELSEQFNGNNGFECSVRNLTWSYASFISAVRARNQI